MSRVICAKCGKALSDREKTRGQCASCSSIDTGGQYGSPPVYGLRGIYSNEPQDEFAEHRRRQAQHGQQRRRDGRRWFLAVTGLSILLGTIFYFPFFAEFLSGTGVKNEAFVQSVRLPLAVFGGLLIFLAIFAKRRAKAVIVSLFLLLVVIAGLFA
jgi:hypothetical protein